MIGATDLGPIRFLLLDPVKAGFGILWNRRKEVQFPGCQDRAIILIVSETN